MSIIKEERRKLQQQIEDSVKTEREAEKQIQSVRKGKEEEVGILLKYIKTLKGTISNLKSDIESLKNQQLDLIDDINKKRQINEKEETALNGRENIVAEKEKKILEIEKSSKDRINIKKDELIKIQTDTDNSITELNKLKDFLNNQNSNLIKLQQDEQNATDKLNKIRELTLKDLDELNKKTLANKATLEEINTKIKELNEKEAILNKKENLVSQKEKELLGEEIRLRDLDIELEAGRIRLKQEEERIANQRLIQNGVVK